MKAVLLATFAATALAGHAAAAEPASEQDARVWREFVELLKAGPFPAEKVRPYHQDLFEPMLGFLETMRGQADWEEWSREPEVFRVGDRVHFLLPLTLGGGTATYCFTFLIEDGSWSFQHMEAIALRMDEIGPLPTSEFPDVSEPTKAWIRAELEVSREVWLYNALAEEKGPEEALDWFKDGPGYALAARAWVPFVSPERAFVLYLCWEQANLRGNEVTLVKLADGEAVVRMRPLYFILYEKLAHLKGQISPGDYRRLFESRWQDRASSAGWKLDISYKGTECTFRLTRVGSRSQ